MKELGLVIRRHLIVIIAIFSLITPFFMGGRDAADAPLNSQECRLNFAAVSDLHIDAYDGNVGLALYSELVSGGMFPDFEEMDERLDAVVISGDVTDHGYESQWVKTEEILGSYDLADNIILSAGNHDTWTRENSDKTFRELFVEYGSRIMGVETDDIYFTREVNGYTFIVLCSESDSTSGYFSQAQISWLKAELAKASEKDLPIFVICHWPINQTHGLPVTFGDDDYDEMTGGMGYQSAEIEAALKEYDNVFLISGHIHAGLSNADDMARTGYQSVESDGSFHSINLPRFNAFNPIGNFMIGTGYTVEVYDDEVVFRARNFLTGNWLPNYDYTIALV